MRLRCARIPMSFISITTLKDVIVARRSVGWARCCAMRLVRSYVWAAPCPTYKKHRRRDVPLHRLAQPHRSLEVDRDELRDAALGHGDAVESVHARHGDRVVRDDDKARI